jgi:hypothetical protein
MICLKNRKENNIILQHLIFGYTIFDKECIHLNYILLLYWHLQFTNPIMYGK